jgi:hypothetical protein
MRWLGLVAAALTLAACSVDRRSERFVCAEPADCEAGRTCVDGWCVVDDVSFDAAPGAPDAPADALVCPPACTRCDGDVCVIECIDPNGCAARVVCPPGMPCRVRCSGAGACPGGVDCASATACQIQCSTEGTCRGALLCGDGPCDISCSGSGSCIAGLNCESSCSCAVTCTGANSCMPSAALCPAPSCTSGAGCSTEPAATCDTCP